MTVMVRRPHYARYMRNAEEAAQNGGSRVYRLAIDAYDTGEEIVITASVPGLDPNNIHINLEDEVLTIEGEFTNNAEDVNYLIRERASEGRFSRSMRINVPVLVDEIEAVFNNGILTLTLPKAPEAKPLTIPVKSITAE